VRGVGIGRVGGEKLSAHPEVGDEEATTAEAEPEVLAAPVGAVDGAAAQARDEVRRPLVVPT
jgi:hypothetical protein